MKEKTKAANSNVLCHSTTFRKASKKDNPINSMFPVNPASVSNFDDEGI